MRFDNRAADREAQSNPCCRGLALAARELLEYGAFLAPGNSRAGVGDAHEQLAVGDLRGQRYDRSRRRVLAGVLEQVVEHALDQRRVELYQGKVAWHGDLDAMLSERRLRGLERATDDFLERLPLATQL